MKILKYIFLSATFLQETPGVEIRHVRIEGKYRMSRKDKFEKCKKVLSYNKYLVDMKNFSLGQNAKASLQNQESHIYGEKLTQFFQLERRAHQGDPSLTYLFILT